MKILTFYIIFALLFIIPLATAIEIEMKTSFSEGETLLAKISGNFYEKISKNDIIFNKDHQRTSIIPFVAEIDEEFYIYAQLLDKSSGNYSIIIENVKHIKGNNLIEENIVKNFTINENSSEFLVDPGFVVTDEDFFIEVRNLQDKKISVGWRILGESSGNNEESEGFFASLFGGGSSESGNLIDLKDGETKKINFEVEGLRIFNLIELSAGNLIYEIPVSVFSMEEETIKEIEEKNETNEFVEEILIEVSEELETNTEAETCSELNGNICGENQKCKGDIKYPSDGTCCIGTCVEDEKSSPSGAVIGWIIIIVIFVSVSWFYIKRYKGAKGISDLTRILKGK